MSTLRHHATASNPTRRSATSRYAALESVEENLDYAASQQAERLVAERVLIKQLPANTADACYQGLKNKVLALLNCVEITGDEARRGRHTLKVSTPAYATLELWRDNLTQLIERRRQNKQALRGALTSTR